MHSAKGIVHRSGVRWKPAGLRPQAPPVAGEARGRRGGHPIFASTHLCAAKNYGVNLSRVEPAMTVWGGGNPRADQGIGPYEWRGGGRMIFAPTAGAYGMPPYESNNVGAESISARDGNV